jgi:hypothetical protein
MLRGIFLVSLMGLFAAGATPANADVVKLVCGLSDKAGTSLRLTIDTNSALMIAGKVGEQTWPANVGLKLTETMITWMVKPTGATYELSLDRATLALSVVKIEERFPVPVTFRGSCGIDKPVL